MSYQSRVKSEKLFHVVSEGYGQPIETFGVTEQGETPVSLVNIALSSCVTMCIQGYFAKIRQDKDVQVETQAVHNQGRFDLTVKLDRQVSDYQTELEAYIADRCKVKQLFREDIEVSIIFEN